MRKYTSAKKRSVFCSNFNFVRVQCKKSIWYETNEGHPAPSPIGHQGDIANGTWMGYHQWDTKGTQERPDWNVFGIGDDFEISVPPYRVIIESGLKTFFFAMNPSKSVSIT